MKSVYDGFSSFLRDECKMHDFITMSMDEFLFQYSYLSVEDYYATYDELMAIIGDMGWETTIREEFMQRGVC